MTCVPDPSLRPVADHRAAVLGLAGPLPVVRAGLDDAAGRALAGDLTAPIALPGFDNSAMDGYVVRSADIALLPTVLPVAHDVPAGRGDGPPLEAGTAHRIMTGAPLPVGAEVIVPVEWTDGGTTRVRIDRAPVPGRHFRRAGEDVRVADAVLADGVELTPSRVGLLAALGFATAPVRRQPVVAVLSTGSELVPPGSPLGPGQIHESNSFLLCAAVRAAGASARHIALVDDDVDACGRRLDEAAQGADLVLTSGGISAGAFEVVKQALGRSGTVEFVRVAMQPGKPQGLGTIGTTPVLTLPGNPVSSFVSFHVFVRPVIRALLGFAELDHPVHRGQLAEPLSTPEGIRVFRRGRYDPSAGGVELVGGAGSHLLGSLAQSNCLVVAEEPVTELGVGAAIPFWSVD